MSNVEEITFCLASADSLRDQIEKLRREEDYFRWRAASLICDELDSGKSQRQLAREIGKSQSLVSFMAAVWRRFGVITPSGAGNHRPYFQDAYRHVQKGRQEFLDRLVPLRDDDDDTREEKSALIYVFADPNRFLDELERAMENMPAEEREKLIKMLHKFVAKLEEVALKLRKRIAELPTDND